MELAIIAGHALGPAGFGTIYIGFAAYISLLVLQRALVTEPLLATSSSLDTNRRATTARHALTVTLAGAIGTSALLGGVGLAIPSQFGRGMILFAPFITPAVVQDLGRSTVFRDQQGPRTALSDLCWLVSMTALAPLAFFIRSDWAIVGCWGVGAIFGAGVALSLMRQAPSPLGAAIRWWRGEPWQLGRWLGLQAMFRSVAAYTWVLCLAGILGTAEYGGLRAVNVVFAPLSLLGPAIALPGLPLISRIVTSSPRRALKLATQLGGLVTLMTAAYFALAYGLQGTLGVLFGDTFLRFRSIVLPIGLAQILIAPAYGFTLLLTAQRRGRTLLLVGSILPASRLIFGVTLALLFGLKGAAWGGGVAASSIYVTAVLSVVVFRGRSN